jgi:uncharacterized protein YciI
MVFVVIGKDRPDARRLRRYHREAHLRRLSALNEEKRLLLAGPFSDGTGSLIVLEAESREEVIPWMEADSYVTEKVFVSYEVKPLMRVFPTTA